jgi:triosephosphate isomerase (TIM)
MLQRHRLIVGNWKMHKSSAEAADYVERLAAILGGNRPPEHVVIVLAPPFTALATVAQHLKGRPYALAAQNLHWEDQGAFTGEVSGSMLKELGCRYVIVGHSERRRYFGESDAVVHKKVAAAFRHGLQPIVCVGESWDQRLSGQTEHVLSLQVIEALESVEKNQAMDLVLAYEPIWAIGSGRPATPEQAQEAHQHIRTQLIALWGPDVGERVPILYGGSVTPDNSAALLAESEVDGALVGGACLDPVLFAKILFAAGVYGESHPHPSLPPRGGG